MELKSMKIKAESISNEIKESGIEEEQYPYGLRLHLDTESIKNIGMKELPKVGETVMVLAKATISGVHESENMGGEKNRSVDIQITDLNIQKEDLKKRPEDVIYGES